MVASRSDGDVIRNIQALTSATLAVDNSLSDANRQFMKLARTVGAEQFIKLEEIWQSHRTAYVGVLWKAREYAGFIESNVKDLASSVSTFLKLNDSRASLQQKITFMENYVKKSNKIKETASAIQDSFRRWVSELDTFLLSFQHEITALGTKIAQSRVTIGNLNETETKLREQIRNLLEELGISKGKDGQRAVSALSFSFLPPSVSAIKPLYGAIRNEDDKRFQDLIKLLDKFQETYYDIKKLQEGLETMRAVMAQVLQVKKGISDAVNKYDDVLPATTAFTNIANILSKDSNNIISKLKAEPFSQEDLNQLLDSLVEPYKKLQAAFASFGSSVISPVNV